MRKGNTRSGDWQKMREDYQRDREDAILADKVSDWVKNYLFPHYKFLKKGWMDFLEKADSLSSLVKQKIKRWGPAFPSHWNTETSGIG